MKVADFGFATYKNIKKLNSYRGTLTYMAPEIKESKEYDGRKVDIFSTGVILFIIVHGIFPFREAKPDEYFYNLIKKGDLKTYWKKVGGEHLSDEFKDLFIKMVSYDPEKRPTVDEIKNHSWFNQKIIEKDIRKNLFERLHDKRSQKTTESSRDEETCRCNSMLSLIRETKSSDLMEVYKLNDMREFDIEVNPNIVWYELQSFNFNSYDQKLDLNVNYDKKYLEIKNEAFKIKVKFY